MDTITSEPKGLAYRPAETVEIERIFMCEICDTSVYCTAEHAKRYGWELGHGEEFCPEHRGL